MIEFDVRQRGKLFRGLVVIIAAVVARSIAAEDASPTEKPPLPETIAIAGRCVDATNQPLAGATMRLFLVDYSTGRGVDGDDIELAPAEREKAQHEVAAAVNCDAQGQFVFNGVPTKGLSVQKPIYLFVVAQMPGRATVNEMVAINGPIPKLTLTMQVGGLLSGRVVDPEGKPVAGALVHVGGVLRYPTPGFQAALTDADGHFAIGDTHFFDMDAIKPQQMGNGMAVMMATPVGSVQHPDFATQPFEYRKVPGSIEVKLQRPAILSGKTLLGKDLAPADAVELFLQSNRDHYQARVLSDSLGHYVVKTLPPGKYRLLAMRKDLPTMTQAIELKPGDNSLDVLLTHGGIVKGRVIDVSTGKPVVLAAGQQMSISPHDAKGVWTHGMGSAEIQPDGTFTLILPVGKNYLGMYLGEGWRGVNLDAMGSKGIEIAEGETKELEIRVKPRKPEDNLPPKPLAAEEAQQLSEKAAAAAIGTLGGWTKRETVDGQEHVVEVNMVYHEDEENGREENRILTDECLFYVRKFPKLRGLFLTREQASDEGLANIHGMESLETLLIWDATAVTDVGAAHIATLPNLKDLHLSNSQLTDEGLRALSKLKSVKSLSLQGNRFTDEGMPHLRNMTQLKSLCLGMNKGGITDEGVKQLAGLTNLELLDLQDTKVTDDGLQSLFQMKQLKDLWANTTTITPAGLKALRKKLPKLKAPREEP